HDAETGAGLLNMTAAVHLAKVTKPEVEVDEKSLQFIPLTWSGEGLVTPMERAADPDVSSPGSSQVSNSSNPVRTFSDFLKVFGNTQSSGFRIFLRRIFDGFYLQNKYNNKGLVGRLLFQTHRGLDNRIATRYSSDGQNWSAWKKENIPNEVTYYQPVVAKLNGVAYQSHVGKDKKIYTRSSTNGINWTAWKSANVSNEETNYAVAMTALNGRLYQSHVGKDKKIYTRSSTNGINWTAWKSANVSNEEAYGDPWLEAFNGKLYQYHIGKEGYLYMRSSNDEQNWSAWKRMGNARTHFPEKKDGGGKYYPELASFSTDKWDIQSGDDNQFRPNSPFGGSNQMWKTSDTVRQVYTDLSKAIFGSRVHMNAGYAYDQSYYNGFGKWHAGIDMGAPAGTPIKAVVGGTVNWVNSDFMGIDSDDGNHWVYGHLGTKYVSRGQRIEVGQTLAVLDFANHLHLEVQHGHSYKRTNGAHPNQGYVRSVTMSPLQAYWKLRNR
ncbi:M23 family metallopeptidase, partial [Phormidium sp. CCY1219]|uniref:M23 family metallopeptidase n=1 Tax=Phormidium sp. CCY1219 TaxID=2886104 RepID=UPI002D1F1A80